MRALRIHRHGQPVFETDAPRPVAGVDEAIVDLVYAGINPVDVFIMQGGVAPDAPLPRVLGIDGAGYLDGIPVLVHGAGVGVFRDGTIAEQVAAPRVAIVTIPDGVSLESATGCGNAGGTAVRLFQLSEAQPSDHALVLAASGSVGAAICSLLAAAGVRVSAQIRRESAFDFVRDAGGTPLFARTPADLTATLGRDPPNILFDPLGGEWAAAAMELLPIDARHIVYGTITGQTIEINLRNFYRRSGTMRSYRGILEPAERLREACILAMKAVAEGRLKIPIGPRVPINSGVEAYEHIRTSHVGRVVVEIASDA